MTKHEILDKIASSYTSENRSVVPSGIGCLYKGDQGKECAFAMMVKEESKDKLIDGVTAAALFGAARGITQDDLKPEYQGHSLAFYDSCQLLHDQASYWNYTGLNQRGKRALALIKEEYENT